MSLEAVIFDMDGVLIDTRQLITGAITDVLAARGLTATASDIANVTGKPVHGMYEVLAPGHDALLLEKEHLAHHEGNLHLITEYGAEDILPALSHSYRLGVFTGFNELSRSRLDMFDLSKFFEVIIDSSQYSKHKPDPEGLFLCMSELGVTPEETVYVGDGISDILVGKAAGVNKIVGITQGFGSREDFAKHGADYIIDSLIELPPILKELQR